MTSMKKKNIYIYIYCPHSLETGLLAVSLYWASFSRIRTANTSACV